MREELFKWILSVEGGYVDDEDDMGGETNYGITKETLVDAHARGIVSHSEPRELIHDEAFDIYEELYYKASKADLLPAPLDMCQFDAAVNHGVGRAGKFLQRTINRFTDNNLLVDGAVGPKTLEALEEVIDLRPDSVGVASHYLLERALFYNAIVSKHPKQIKFLHGWMNRLYKLSQKI